MSLELKQSLKLSQQLVITQQIQQAIRLLQLNHLEMVREIQQEMVENPALEEIPGTTPDLAPSAEGVVDDKLGSIESARDDDGVARDGGDDINWERFLNGYSQGSPGPR